MFYIPYIFYLSVPMIAYLCYLKSYLEVNLFVYSIEEKIINFILSVLCTDISYLK